MSRSSAYQTAVSLLRRTGSLRLVDWLRYLQLRRASGPSRDAFQRRHGDAPLPPDDLAYDAYGTLNWQQYWESGAETAALIGDILQRELPERGPRRVLEWGCGPARVVRHMPALLNAAADWLVLATDFNPATIRWCRANIADVAFSENGLVPPLRQETASLDAVYCISVFTHLSEELQRAWARELARVLRPGGILIASFHGEATRSYLLASERRRFDRGEAVVRGSVPEGTRIFTAYQPQPFVESLLSPAFAILERRTGAVPSLGLQDLYVARRAAG